MKNSDRTISSFVAKMTFGERTLCGNSKMVFCEHPGRTLFGGVGMPNISNIADGNWHMAIGSLIFVPLRVLSWKKGICGWKLEDLLREGLVPELWKEPKVEN
jgi:hypothetical protein